MTRLLHDIWPVVAVTLFTTLLVLQIPRKALFPSFPVEKTPEPIAAFVEYDDDAYSALIQNVRMSWQVRSRTLPAGDDNRTSAFDFDNPLPEPDYLPLEASLSRGEVGGATSNTRHLDSIPYPSSQALSGKDGIFPEAPEMPAVNPRDPALLEIPDSLQK